jgi:ParB family chromosome partitioning protein
MSRKTQPPKSDRAGIGVKDRNDTPQPEQLSVARSAISVPLTQPRRYFEPTKMQQLIESIKTHGILENLLVRPIPGKDGLYELIAGERRFRAAIAAGLEMVPVTIKSNLNDEQALQLALIENLQREDLNAVEETEAILQLLTLNLGVSAEQVTYTLYRMEYEAKRQVTHNIISNDQIEIITRVFSTLGKFTWESFVSNRLPLLRLNGEILSLIGEGKLTYTKAIAIARVKEDDLRAAMLKDAIAQKLTVAQIKERIKAMRSNSVSPSPIATIEQVTRLLRTSKVWEKPQKWKRVETLLQELSEVVAELEVFG